MRLLIALITLCLSYPLLAAPRAVLPQRVISMSLCTDQLLLWLAETQQIAAVSHLAQDPLYSVYSDRAQKVTTHRADVETIVQLKPDMVLASRYERSQATRILQRLGFNVVIVDDPITVEQIGDQVLLVANLLEKQEIAQRALAEIKQQLELLQKNRIAKKELVVSLSANGYQQGRHSMHNQFMNRIGLKTVADQLQWESDGSLSIEQFVRLKPALLIRYNNEQGGSLAERWTQHPALKSHKTQQRIVDLNIAEWICVGPWTVAAALRLQHTLQQ